MPTILLNNREIEIPGTKPMNAIEAAQLAGVTIPHYCWHPGLSVVGSCRMCLIEVGMRDPKTSRIAMQPKLVPACNTTIVDNMVLVTDSEKVARARAMVEESLLLRHPIDCPICDKAGECRLQDYHFQFGQSERRADLRPYTSRRRDIGDVTLFVDRCVLCSRCVRFTAEISGTHELMIAGRGVREEIDVVPGFPLNNRLSGNVVDLCPVGALGDKDFLYQQRVWFLRGHPGVCTGCATGCSIWIEENQERIYRVRPRENPRVNKWWICNDGRYDYPHVHNPRRLTQAVRRTGEGLGIGGEGLEIRDWGLEEAPETADPFAPKAVPSNPQSLIPNPSLSLDWTTLPGELVERLRATRRLAAVVSPHLTVEEAYLLCTLIRRIDREALLAIGPVPVVGEDERFPGGFTISAERCPNRRGVEEVIAHFAHRVDSFDSLLAAVDANDVRGVWVSGGYKTEWIGRTTARRFERLDLVVLQDLFPSALSEWATYVLPGAAYAERDGSYVNRFDRLQSVPWAIRPPMGVRTEGSLLWEMLGRRGLYDSKGLLQEIAREILYFSAALGTIPETGVDLRSNLLANATDRTQGDA